MHGDNGYPTIVNDKYAACSVHSAEGGYTDIYYIGDSLFYEFLPETGEFASEHKHMNFVHTALFNRLLATSRSLNATLTDGYLKSFNAAMSKKLKILMKMYPDAKTIILGGGYYGMSRQSGNGIIDGDQIYIDVYEIDNE